MIDFRVSVSRLYSSPATSQLSIIGCSLDKLMRNWNENDKNGKKEIKCYKEQSKSSKVKIVIAY